MAATVEGDDTIAAGATVHDDQVVAFFRAEPDFPGGGISRLTVGAEVGHGVREVKVRVKEQSDKPGIQGGF